MLFSGISLGVVLYYFISIALNGGYIGLLTRERGYKVASLLRSGFGNYKFLFLISLISIAGTVIIIGFGVVLQLIIVKIFAMKTEPGYVFTFIGIFSVLSIVYLIKEILIDYMRILYFRNLGEKTSIHFVESIKYVLNNIVPLLLFGISMAIVLTVIYIIAFIIGEVFNSVNYILILLSFILHQLTIWVRIYWRSIFWTGEIALLEGPLGGKITEKDLWPEDEL